MEIATFIALVAALNFWAMYGSVPFTTIHPSRPFHERLSGSLQATSVVYVLDSLYEHYTDPPHTSIDDDHKTETLVGADPPLPTRKTELDYLMEMVREEYAEKGNMVVLFPAETAAPLTSTALSPKATIRPDSSNDTVARRNITTHGPNQKAGNDDAAILSFIGVVSVICMVWKYFFGQSDASSEGVPPRLEQLEDIEDRLLRRVSEHIDQSLAPLRDLTARQEASAAQSAITATLDRLATELRQIQREDARSTTRQESSATESLIKSTATLDRLASEFQQIRQYYERSAAPRLDPPAPVQVHSEPVPKDNGESQSRLHDELPTLETLRMQQVSWKTELEQLVRIHLDNLRKETMKALKNVDVELTGRFDIKLTELQETMRRQIDPLSSKVDGIIRDLTVENRDHLRNTVHKLLDKVKGVSERMNSTENELKQISVGPIPPGVMGYPSTSLKDLGDKVEAIRKGQAALLKQHVSTVELTNNVEDLQGELKELSEKVTSIESNVAWDKALTDEVQSIDSALKALSDRLATLEAEVSSGPSTADLAKDMEDDRNRLQEVSDDVEFIKKEQDALSSQHEKSSADLTSDVEACLAYVQTLSKKLLSIEERQTGDSDKHSRSTVLPQSQEPLPEAETTGLQLSASKTETSEGKELSLSRGAEQSAFPSVATSPSAKRVMDVELDPPKPSIQPPTEDRGSPKESTKPSPGLPPTSYGLAGASQEAALSPSTSRKGSSSVLNPESKPFYVEQSAESPQRGLSLGKTRLIPVKSESASASASRTVFPPQGTIGTPSTSKAEEKSPSEKQRPEASPQSGQSEEPGGERTTEGLPSRKGLDQSIWASEEPGGERTTEGLPSRKGLDQSIWASEESKMPSEESEAPGGESKAPGGESKAPGGESEASGEKPKEKTLEELIAQALSSGRGLGESRWATDVPTVGATRSRGTRGRATRGRATRRP